MTKAQKMQAALDAMRANPNATHTAASLGVPYRVMWALQKDGAIRWRLNWFDDLCDPNTWKWELIQEARNA